MAQDRHDNYFIKYKTSTWLRAAISILKRREFMQRPRSAIQITKLNMESRMDLNVRLEMDLNIGLRIDLSIEIRIDLNIELRVDFNM